jgi:hypothetical protein
MEFNDYEMQLVSRLRLAEFRANAARHAVASAAASERRARLRARVGRGLVRLGHLIEGRGAAGSDRAPLAVG